MFEVRATRPYEDDFQEEDRIIEQAALPLERSFGGAGSCRDMSGDGRELGFYAKTFDEAVAAKQRIHDTAISGLIVIVREK